MDALYAEAEQVYRKFVAEDVRLVRGGLLPDERILSLMTGDQVSSYVATRQQAHEKKVTATGGEFELVYVKRSPSVFEGGDVALEACIDGSSVTGYRDGQNVGPGQILHSTATLKRVGNDLKIWHRANEVVSSC